MENRKTKLIWSIVLIVVVVSGLTSSALADLLAHYTFNDGTADDSSGNSHDGTLMGGASIVYDFGQWNKDWDYVLQVNSSLQQHVNCGGGNGGWGGIPQEAVTIAAWYKPTGDNGNFATIVSKGLGEANDGWSLSRYMTNDDVTFTCSSIPNWWGLPSTNPDAWDGQWHHVVGVFVNDDINNSPASVKIYIDGTLSDSAEKWGLLIRFNEQDVIIGGSVYPWPEPGYLFRFFNGLIDDVRIYDEVLDEYQILDIYLGYSTADIKLTVKVDPNNAGIDTLTPGAGEHMYYHDQPLHLIVDDFVDCPNVYKFDHWVGDVSDVNALDTLIVMTEDKTVTAVFANTQECGDQCHPILDGDVNGDCYINFEDFAIYCAQWLSCTHPDCEFVLVPK